MQQLLKLNPAKDLSKQLYYFKNKSLGAAAKELKISEVGLFWTTYRAFIHELGHAFGLCDTDALQYDVQCDAGNRSKLPQADSIMLNSGYFYLTDDDKKGLCSMHNLINQDSPAKC